MAKKRSGCGCLTAVMLVAVIALSCALVSKERIISRFFPLTYQNQVTACCAEYGVDFWLAMAVIREESGFDPEAQSGAGACGLMQLMPDTAVWISDKIGLVYNEDTIWQPEANIRMGIWYIAWLTAQYDGHQPAAIAAYNGGKTNVDQWQSDGIWSGELEDATQIPFAETRRFVQQVFNS
ncbi:MAG: lytic transglycosylase domain-containing protein, partial [Clostridiales bacterium]